MPGEAAPAESGKNTGRRFKAYDSALDQYQRLKALLPVTEDIAERNRIYLRLRNLLGVMQFLNSQSRQSL